MNSVAGEPHVSYDHRFFAGIHLGSLESARVVVPLVQEIVPTTSIVDVGCGTGSWLATFGRLGAERLLGIDGDYVDRDLLMIPEENFLARDLNSSLDLQEEFDLALCLEVAEHLSPVRAPFLVHDLVSAAPIVLFSAAIPGQGGTGHINEQWPDYWSALFAKEGYSVIDALRPRIWSDKRVDVWYRQNLLLFADRHLITMNHRLAALKRSTKAEQLSVVHPVLWREHQWELRRDAARRELVDTVPGGAEILLIDEGQLGLEQVEGRRLAPFPQENGDYSGIPATETAAVAAFREELASGTKFVAVAWPAFWWLDYYPALADELADNLRLAASTQDILIFRRP